ncbi:hypothetical protein HRbin40_02050 [bacterium HR40]|nr:hypothetical protein HRbin40_02050 [bacterium HR40]
MSGRLRAGLLAGIVGMVASCAPAGPPPATAPAPVSAPPPLARPIGRELPAQPARFPILGADAATLEQLFGPPNLRRRELPAEYWRYDFARCTLDLFLFRAPGEAKARVVYFELREQTPYAAAHGCRELEARVEAVAPGPVPLAETREH